MYRLLTSEEISLLLSQGCSAEKWTDIAVKEGFLPHPIRNTRFEGIIKLGVFSGSMEVEKGMVKRCGIYNSDIRQCEIGDNVYISNAGNLANYIIETNVAIENVGSMVVNEASTFGNGTEIEVLNEGGGRELPIFDRLSSQIAYLTVLYRHDKDFTDRLLGMIRAYSESKRSAMGRIESGARILHTQIIRNVHVGGYAIVSGARLLEDGTILSCREAPAIIGDGVIAKKFIMLSGSEVTDAAIIDKTFVGQGVRVGKQFSAENSLFFANCEAFHGEACSLFAGPYTVTHHKSTLLIASLFSFFNAGSGTNQSNHMYKLGPVHQGILERGSKTGSFAYLLLPCYVGAYSVVMGKHYGNFDTVDFPFSYITEEKGKSELTPAMNLFTVGTRRDSEKWPTRDKRADPDKLDLIHYNLFNPYIVGRIVNGINILNDLAEKTPKTQNYVNYKGIHIHRLLLKTARKYYEMALKVYIGQEVVMRLEGMDENSTQKEIGKYFEINDTTGTGKWVEICGLFAPMSQISALMDAVKTGNIKSLAGLSEKLRDIYHHYDAYAWAWCVDLIKHQTGTDMDNISADKLLQIIGDWKTHAIRLNNMTLNDAEKEFDTNSRLGFGIDGDEHTRNMDFHTVRGAYEDNKFVLSLKKETLDIEDKADKIMALLEKIKPEQV
jgi:NDP-sugar pyrophosphorylase family protein